MIATLSGLSPAVTDLIAVAACVLVLVAAGWIAVLILRREDLFPAELAASPAWAASLGAPEDVSRPGSAGGPLTAAPFAPVTTAACPPGHTEPAKADSTGPGRHARQAGREVTADCATGASSPTRSEDRASLPRHRIHDPAFGPLAGVLHDRDDDAGDDTLTDLPAAWQTAGHATAALLARADAVLAVTGC